MPPRSLRAAVLALSAATALLIANGAYGAAAPTTPSVQEQIDAHLAAYPGGKQINATEVAYNEGAFVITFARAPYSVAGTPDCPSGWFCFYEHTNFGYPKGKLSDCGWQDLTGYGWHNRTESVHYNMSSGSVTFVQHVNASHSGDYGIFSNGVGNPIDNDVSPYRNMADHVYRFC